MHPDTKIDFFLIFRDQIKIKYNRISNKSTYSKIIKSTLTSDLKHGHVVLTSYHLEFFKLVYYFDNIVQQSRHTLYDF